MSPEPSSAAFPAAIATAATLGGTVVNQKTYVVSGAQGSSVTTILTTATITGITAPNYLAVGNTGEIIYFEGISGASFTSCTRAADGTVNEMLTDGAILYHINVANLRNQQVREMIAIETELGINPPDVDDTVDAVAAAANLALRLDHIANIIKTITGKAAWYTDPDTTLKNISAQIFLSATAGVPKTTAGCAAATQVEMATNKQNLKTLDFDASTEEHGDFTFALPSDYNGGTMTAKFVWMHAATTTNFGVVWGIEGRCYADDDALDQAVGTAQTATDTGGTTSDVYISPATAAITWAGTPLAGQLINLTVFRKAADGADTMAIDARLIGVQLTYVRS